MEEKEEGLKKAALLIDFEELTQSLAILNVDEIGLIPPPCSPNVVVVENKLGISMAILKPLFRYALSEFKLLRKLIKANDDYMYFLDDTSLRHLAAISQAMLLVRGDLPMAWITRKQLIDCKIIRINKELNFLNALFTLHPKSPSGKCNHTKHTYLFEFC